MENTALWDAIGDEFPTATHQDRVALYGVIQHQINQATQNIFEWAKTEYEKGTI